MKFEKIVQINVGQNISRFKGKQSDRSGIYTNEDLIGDLQEGLRNLATKADTSLSQKDKYQLFPGDILYSFVSSKAGIVSNKNTGKLFNQNFAKLTLLSDEIDSKYICYILNESVSIKKQMAILMQGSVVPKLTPAILREIDIKLPNKDTQSVIGTSYFNLNRYQYLTELETDLNRRIYLEMLKKLDV
ncbi:restriction endonuclease subunit S [Carnobacterium sp. CS13]|uniref:restriction endonuclease subunit S n=1 Tax=Carnobacterium sp. CS13 TaxID=2800128 RepID=UPI00191466E0|nr:restriction endonuclease subunit S [Carnobacterium sp. CS13]QQP70181.1 restriction endonuclease subunit S [Carnobacterium sp. CS13]